MDFFRCLSVSDMVWPYLASARRLLCSEPRRWLAEREKLATSDSRLGHSVLLRDPLACKTNPMPAVHRPSFYVQSLMYRRWEQPKAHSRNLWHPVPVPRRVYSHTPSSLVPFHGTLLLASPKYRWEMLAPPFHDPEPCLSSQDRSHPDRQGPALDICAMLRHLSPITSKPRCYLCPPSGLARL